MSERNVFGAFDRLVTTAAMILAVVAPTALIGLLAPWKLAPMVWREEPSGRRGPFLSPGLFFVVAITGAVFLAGATYPHGPADEQSSPGQELEDRATFFGLSESLQLARAVAEGEFSKALLVISPVFLFAVFGACVSMAVRPMVGPNWTMTVSIRAWFYFIGIAISVIFTIFAILQLFVDPRASNVTFSGDLPMLVVFLYFFTSIFRTGLELSLIRAFGAALLCLAAWVASLIGLVALVQLV